MRLLAFLAAASRVRLEGAPGGAADAMVDAIEADDERLSCWGSDLLADLARLCDDLAGTSDAELRSDCVRLAARCRSALSGRAR